MQMKTYWFTEESFNAFLKSLTKEESAIDGTCSLTGDVEYIMVIKIDNKKDDNKNIDNEVENKTEIDIAKVVEVMMEEE